MKILTFSIATACALTLTACTAQNQASNKQLKTAHASTQVQQPSPQDQINFHLIRVKNDPQGAIGHAMLAEAYLSKSRKYDDDNAAVNAENSARSSLKIRQSNNARAAIVLTQSLLAQHRFQEAHETATTAHNLAPNNLTALRILAETNLELGNYKVFKALLPDLKLNTSSPDISLTLARWEAINNKPTQAIKRIQFTIQKLRPQLTHNPQVLAAYITTLADLQFQENRIDSAESNYQEARKLDPENYKPLRGLAQTALAKNQPTQAIKYAHQSLRIATLTDTLTTLALAYQALDDQTNYTLTINQIDKLNQPHSHTHSHDHSHDHHHHRHTHNRLYAKSLIATQRKPKLALTLAQEDLKFRKDKEAHKLVDEAKTFLQSSKQ